MSDWFFRMGRSRVELTGGWFQQQLRLRGFDDGPVDGPFNRAIDQAIAANRAALGRERAARPDERFFAAVLGADPSRIQPPDRPWTHVASASAAGTPATSAGSPSAGAGTDHEGSPRALRLAVSTRRPQNRFAVGQPISDTVHPSRDAHLAGYLQDEDGKVARLLQSRLRTDARVPAGEPLAGQSRAVIRSAWRSAAGAVMTDASVDVSVR